MQQMGIACFLLVIWYLRIVVAFRSPDQEQKYASRVCCVLVCKSGTVPKIFAGFGCALRSAARDQLGNSREQRAWRHYARRVCHIKQQRVSARRVCHTQHVSDTRPWGQGVGSQTCVQKSEPHSMHVQCYQKATACVCAACLSRQSSQMLIGVTNMSRRHTPLGTRHWLQTKAPYTRAHSQTGPASVASCLPAQNCLQGVHPWTDAFCYWHLTHLSVGRRSHRCAAITADIAVPTAAPASG